MINEVRDATKIAHKIARRPANNFLAYLSQTEITLTTSGQHQLLIGKANLATNHLGFGRRWDIRDEYFSDLSHKREYVPWMASSPSF